jgi:hypothetical protein
MLNICVFDGAIRQRLVMSDTCRLQQNPMEMTELNLPTLTCGTPFVGQVAQWCRRRQANLATVFGVARARILTFPVRWLSYEGLK